MSEITEVRPDIINTAFHEAGHAVLHIYFDHHIEHVSIKPNGDTFGVATSTHPDMYYYPSRRYKNQNVRQYIIACYAGYEAEKLYDPLAESYFAGNDEAEAWKLLLTYPVKGASFVGDEVYDEYAERLRKEARRLVKQLWPKIDVIARELLKRGEMTGDEIEALFRNQ